MITANIALSLWSYPLTGYRKQCLSAHIPREAWSTAALLYSQSSKSFHAFFPPSLNVSNGSLQTLHSFQCSPVMSNVNLFFSTNCGNTMKQTNTSTFPWIVSHVYCTVYEHHCRSQADQIFPLGRSAGGWVAYCSNQGQPFQPLLYCSGFLWPCAFWRWNIFHPRWWGGFHLRNVCGCGRTEQCSSAWPPRGNTCSDEPILQICLRV